MAMMAKPFGSELPGAAMRTALHQQALLLQPRPVRRRQSVGLGHRDRQARGQIGRARCVVHSVAPEPRRRLLAGVTIGPPITIATSFRLTWLTDWPRIWRTA